MPALRNPIQERFCQAIARGVNGKNAAREAGYAEASAHVRACELLKKPDVKARIEELRAKAEKHIVQSVAVNEEWVLQRLIGNVENAEKAGDRAAVNRGLELIAKLKGYLVDRKADVTNPLSNLNTEQLSGLLGMLSAYEAAQEARSGAPVQPAEAMQVEHVHQPVVEVLSDNRESAQPDPLSP